MLVYQRVPQVTMGFNTHTQYSNALVDDLGTPMT